MQTVTAAIYRLFVEYILCTWKQIVFFFQTSFRVAYLMWSNKLGHNKVLLYLAWYVRLLLEVSSFYFSIGKSSTGAHGRLKESLISRFNAPAVIFIFNICSAEAKQFIPFRPPQRIFKAARLHSAFWTETINEPNFKTMKHTTKWFCSMAMKCGITSTEMHTKLLYTNCFQNHKSTVTKTNVTYEVMITFYRNRLKVCSF